MGGSSSELSGPDLAKGIELSQLTEGQPLLGHAGGEAVVVVRRGEQCFAVSATCTHYSGPLAEGLVTGGTIHCPWHHARFDLATGRPLGGPGINPLSCYEVAREGSLVRIGGKRGPTPAPRPPRAPSSVVIIGAGPSGLVAAETLRREGYDGPITIVGDEGIPIDRPNLSKDYLAGSAPEEWMPLRDQAGLAAQKIALVTTHAQSLDLARKQVVLADGKTLPYDALVLATGAAPIRLPMPGAELPSVHLLRTLADSRAIIAAATKPGVKSAVVIGGGFIGLEAAASLRARKIDVTVLVREKVTLDRVLGETMGAFVEALHVEKGVHFSRVAPVSIERDGVTLADGQRLPADLVVMGVGVRPRVELADAAGLKVDNGIVVDQNLRTSAPDVYAIGDVARFPWAGAPVRIEHFVHAERMGFVAARNILGHAQPFDMAPFFWSQHYDVPIAYVGGGAWDKVEVIGDPQKRDVLAVYRSGGRPVALASIYRDGDSLRFEDLLERGDVPGIEALLAEARVVTGG
jgi:NADPH-dependent 2,4-dienoyl-CoA reductase/sulfur reductase-like enzyme/nitrite reductase/ring-hydroxylating ferredoxin subunit